MKNAFIKYGAASILALAVLGIGALSAGNAYAQEEEPCLGVVGETVESEVEFTERLVNDPGAVAEEEINSVLDSVHDPSGLLSDEIETVREISNQYRPALTKVQLQNAAPFSFINN